MQIKRIVIQLSSIAELEHYFKVFENTIYKPDEEIINNRTKKYNLILKLTL